MSHPRRESFSRVTIAHFTPRSFRIRIAHEEDLPQLVRFETLPARRASHAAKGAREADRAYPLGQLLLVSDGEVRATAYSQRISDPDDLKILAAETVEDFHDPTGPVVQLLAVTVPDTDDVGHGDTLLEFALQRCRVTDAIESVVAVTRCRDYATRSDGLGFEEFLEAVDAHGRSVDPAIRFHQQHGAALVGAISSYRPRDVENAGFGVLMSYDLAYARTDDTRAASTPCPEASGTQGGVAASALGLVRQIVAAGLTGRSEEDVLVDRPLMEMGLDSSDLVEIAARIREDFAIPFRPSLFFEHNSIEKIAAHIDGLQGARETPRRSASEQQAPEPLEQPALEPSRSVPVRSRPGDVAVVGMAFRFPSGIRTPGELRLLEEGASAVGTLPQERRERTWRGAETEPHLTRGGFLERIDEFDADFFRVAPAEAQLMDPQQRMMLHLVWEALEDSCQAPASMRGSRTGVYVGACHFEYRGLFESLGIAVDARLATGTGSCLLANRLSYFFDWRGPSMLLDTACSSSLVALHSAVRGLRSGECEQAVVGGVNLICDTANTLAYDDSGMLSREGRCATFDAVADGYVRAEGGAVIVLKLLQDAIRDGDSIYAVVKGSAVNHGGEASRSRRPTPRPKRSWSRAPSTTPGCRPRPSGTWRRMGPGRGWGIPSRLQA